MRALKLFRITNCFFASVLFSAGALAAAPEQSPPAGVSSERNPDHQPNLEMKKIGLAIHGGAGTIERTNMTPEREHEFRAGLEGALRLVTKFSGAAARVSTRQRPRYARSKTIHILTQARVQCSQAPEPTRWTQRSWTGKRSLPARSLL